MEWLIAPNLIHYMLWHVGGGAVPKGHVKRGLSCWTIF